MKGVLGIAAVVALFLGANLAGPLQGYGSANAQPRAPAAKQEAEGQGPVKVIEVTARKYEYSPSEIRVKRGTRVQLKIRALDRTHGFKIAPYPEGAEHSGPAGLKFAQQQDNWKLEKDQERVIEFVAERAGIYPFKCSVFCGLGHGGMKGTLIVEE